MANILPCLTPVKLTLWPELDFSLPLREIDILVRESVMTARVIDSSSQIIVIHKDLTSKISTHLSTSIRLEIEGANSATNWTLGCAENLTLQVGDVPFKVHAHVIEHAPFCLLLSCPFQKILQCTFEDQPNGSMDVTIQDHCNCSHHVVIPSREHCTQVGCMRILSVQLMPPPPCMTTPKQFYSHAFNLPPLPLLAYKKVTHKVRPIPASLPEDFCIMCCCPEDPLLMLQPLPTHPPPSLLVHASHKSAWMPSTSISMDFFGQMS